MSAAILAVNTAPSSTDAGDTAWVLVSAGLVLFMTPGLAPFYGGMVRAKNVFGIIMQNFFCMGIVSVLWVLLGFSLAFGPDAGGGLIGGLGMVGLRGVAHGVPGFHLTVPPLAFVVFQMMFAIITPALITGATADRLKFTGFVVFVSVWLLLVYCPIAHWSFSPGGWLYHRGALDFAGGTVVEINSGFSSLAAAIVVGRRRGWPEELMSPHSLPLTLLGAGILWFGWFGFNAGSALSAGPVATQALLNTQLAAAAGLLGWVFLEALRTGGKPTTLGGPGQWPGWSRSLRAPASSGPFLRSPSVWPPAWRACWPSGSSFAIATTTRSTSWPFMA